MVTELVVTSGFIFFLAEEDGDVAMSRGLAFDGVAASPSARSASVMRRLGAIERGGLADILDVM